MPPLLTKARGSGWLDYIGAEEDSIIFTRGTTESINLVVRAWGETHISQGDVILLTEMEHHSNLVPWQLLAHRKGAMLRFIPSALTACSSWKIWTLARWAR